MLVGTNRRRGQGEVLGRGQPHENTWTAPSSPPGSAESSADHPLPLADSPRSFCTDLENWGFLALCNMQFRRFSYKFLSHYLTKADKDGQNATIPRSNMPGSLTDSFSFTLCEEYIPTQAVCTRSAGYPLVFPLALADHCAVNSQK